MKYLCFGCDDKVKFDGMTESDRYAMFDTCFEYDDHLRASGHWAGFRVPEGANLDVALVWGCKAASPVGRRSRFALSTHPKSNKIR